LFDPWSFMLVLAVVLLKAPVFKQMRVSSSVRTVLEVGWSRKWFFFLARNSYVAVSTKIRIITA
jgi:hypothetical protein